MCCKKNHWAFSFLLISVSKKCRNVFMLTFPYIQHYWNTIFNFIPRLILSFHIIYKISILYCFFKRLFCIIHNRIFTFFKNGKHRNSFGISITRSILYFPFIRFFPSRHTSSKGHSSHCGRCALQ